MTFALIIKVYCCLKQPHDLTEILKNKKDHFGFAKSCPCKTIQTPIRALIFTILFIN